MLMKTDASNVKRQAAFTRVDAATLLCLLSLLVLALSSGSARTRSNDKTVQCLNNLRQFTAAWRMYGEDNSDKLPSAWGNAGQWIGGNLSWSGNPTTDGSNPSNWDVNQDIAKSPLWSYCGKSPDIWRCPADPSSAIPPSGPSQGQIVPRVRSISMNAWFNGADADTFSPGYLKYKKFSEILNPGPARTFVFLDERFDSINDGEMIISMSGYPNMPSQWTLVDVPANYHDRAGSFGFADGHSEVHRWKDPRTAPPLGHLTITGSPNNPDVYWLMDHSTRRP